MKVNLHMSGVSNATSYLKRLAYQIHQDTKVTVVTGYETRYAIYVHEDLTVHHRVGRSKFLEAPTRRLVNTGELGREATKSLVSGKSFKHTLLILGQRIEKESKPNVPVDTGVLADSAFTRYDNG